MTTPRAWGIAFFLAAVTVVVSGVVSIMQVRLRAERVGQEIRAVERETIRLRKEVDHITRDRARAQDALQLARHPACADLRAPEPEQVAWVRPPLAAAPRAAGPLNPRLAALDIAGREAAGSGGPARR
ncbi:MAG: hypothetical protein ACK5VI_10560 [Opitutia bacterium]